jgi:hypothetical protein
MRAIANLAPSGAPRATGSERRLDSWRKIRCAGLTRRTSRCRNTASASVPRAPIAAREPGERRDPRDASRFPPYAGCCRTDLSAAPCKRTRPESHGRNRDNAPVQRARRRGPMRAQLTPHDPRTISNELIHLDRHCILYHAIGHFPRAQPGNLQREQITVRSRGRRR